MKTELDRIRELQARFSGVTSERVREGIGDDAAVIGPPPNSASHESLVWTVDAQVEGTHFRLDWLDWRDVGYRSFMAAVSDVAAMGARPLAALSSLVLAKDVDDAAFQALTEGQAEASRMNYLPIVGGNLARGHETSVTTTVLGTLDASRGERAFTRHDARPGDVVWLGGEVGLAAAGMAALEKKVQDARIAECVAAWRRPRARFDLSIALHMASLGRGSVAGDRAHTPSAVIDVSDGLALDTSRIAESSFVTIVLEEARLRALAPTSLVAASELLGGDPLEWMLYGGEDYALVATAASAEPLAPGFSRVGVVMERGDHALLIERTDGARTPLDVRGFDHFKA